jgi:hypothetical protein
VKTTSPRSSNPLSRTVRALGAPSGVAVASTTALGSASAAASANQAANCASQVGARSASDSPARAYSRRRSATGRSRVTAEG